MERNISRSVEKEVNISRSVEKEVKEFIGSFESTEACAAECVTRQKEFAEQLSAYTDCISNLFNDPRYAPIVTICRIGAVIAVNHTGNNVIQGIFGTGDACKQAIKELALKEDINGKKADTCSEG